MIYYFYDVCNSKEIEEIRAKIYNNNIIREQIKFKDI